MPTASRSAIAAAMSTRIVRDILRRIVRCRGRVLCLGALECRVSAFDTVAAGRTAESSRVRGARATALMPPGEAMGSWGTGLVTTLGWDDDSGESAATDLLSCGPIR